MEHKPTEARKQAVSLRMNVADVRKVKKLAQRLGARDSDVIRFAVKCMLTRLALLYDPLVTGRNLVPVFVEAGAELLRFFDLDAPQLEAIINEDAEPERCVERDDIMLLALNGGQEPYAALLLSELKNPTQPQPGNGELATSLRQYLYEKYVYRGNADAQLVGEPVRGVASGGHHD